MASNVTAEEARAIAQALAGSAREGERPTHVEARQFDRPLRLSTAEIDALREKLRKSLPELEPELMPLMRSAPQLELIELGEVNAGGLIKDLNAPFAALRFEVERQPGWLVWECVPALNAIEVALGAAEPGANAPRAFTPIERSVFVRVLGSVATRLARAVGLTAVNFVVAQDAEGFGSWRQGGDKAETQRLLAAIALNGPGGASCWKLYLPGIVHAQKSAPKPEPKAPLPAHLGEVSVEVKARLGANEVPLADLLALEIGDVIPLRVQVGAPLEVLVEDQPTMLAGLGQCQGKLAVRIAGIERPKSQA